MLYLALVFGLLAAQEAREASDLCSALHSLTRAADLAMVPDSAAECRRIAIAARQQGVPPEIAVAVAYKETRFRPGLVGPGGELGPLQAKPRWWPAVRERPLVAGLLALRVSRRMGGEIQRRKCRERRRPGAQAKCRSKDSWRTGLAYYSGGVERPRWWYASQVLGMARAARDRAEAPISRRPGAYRWAWPR